MDRTKKLMMGTVFLVSLLGMSSVGAIVCIPTSSSVVAISPANTFNPQVQKLLDDVNVLLDQALEQELDVTEYEEMIEKAENTGNALYAKNLLESAISGLEALLS